MLPQSIPILLHIKGLVKTEVTSTVTTHLIKIDWMYNAIFACKELGFLYVTFANRVHSDVKIMFKVLMMHQLVNFLVFGTTCLLLEQ